MKPTHTMKRQPTTHQQQTEHQCLGHKEGDWVIFSCPTCKYLRKINCITKEVIVRQGNASAIHVGSHAPVLTTPEAFSRN